MTQCPHCKKMVPKECHFCIYCMNRLKEEETIRILPRRRFSRRAFLSAVSIAAAALLCGAAGLFYTGRASLPVSGENTVSGTDSELDSELDSSSGNKEGSEPQSRTRSDALFTTLTINNEVIEGCATNQPDIELPDFASVIAEEAFAGQYVIRTIGPTDALTSIRDRAFKGCHNLETFHIGEHTFDIGEAVFDSCVSLRTITCSPDNPFFKSVDGVLYSKDGSRLIAYPAGKRDESFEIPDTVTSIAPWAFSGSVYLRHVSIPASVEELWWPFGNCSALEEITVSPDNPVYTAQEGVLYDKEMKALLAFPAGRNIAEIFKVPESVTVIETNAFLSNRFLKKVVLPEGTEKLEQFAFKNCEALETIVYPTTLKEIDSAAFWGIYTPLVFEGPINQAVKDFTKSNNFEYSSIDSSDIQWSDYSPGADGTQARMKYKDNDTFTAADGTELNISNGVLVSCNTDEEVIKLPDSVTAIGEEAFRGQKTIRQIILPDTVTRIGNEAFGHCSSLEELYIGKNISEIGDTICTHCTSLKEITCDPKNARFMTIDGVLYNKNNTILYMYPPGKEDKSFAVPETVNRIVQWAFAGNSYLTEVTLPSRLKEQSYVLGSCSALEKVLVAEGNQSFVSEDGVLYNADHSILILYPPAKNDTETFMVPDTVKGVEVNAFLENKYLRKIILPEGIEKLYTFSFRECESLEILSCPSTLKSIEEGTFFKTEGITLTGPDNPVTADYAKAAGFAYQPD